MNKKFFWAALIAVAPIALGLTSCSDDDDPKEEVVTKKANEEVAGTYTGGIYGSFRYMPKYLPEEGRTITITANEDSETATVAFSHETWGEFLYEEVSVTKKEDGSYSLEGEGNCVVAPRYGGSASGAEAQTYVTNFTGTIVDGKLVAVLDIPTMMVGGTQIYFNAEDFEEVLASANQPKE